MLGVVVVNCFVGFKLVVGIIVVEVLGIDGWGYWDEFMIVEVGVVVFVDFLVGLGVGVGFDVKVVVGILCEAGLIGLGFQQCLCQFDVCGYLVQQYIVQGVFCMLVDILSKDFCLLYFGFGKVQFVQDIICILGVGDLGQLFV